MKRQGKTKFLFVSVLPILMVCGIAAFFWYDSNKPQVPDLIRSVDITPAKKIHIEGLIDHTSTHLKQSDLQNKWSFIFFGYTNCPDVCPATLTQLVVLKQALSKMSSKSLDAQYLFISVDPQRDSVKHLSDYIQFYNPAFVAATGNESDLERIEQQFDVFHRYDKKNQMGFYTVQHSAEIFLINPNGELTARFAPPMDIPLVVKQVQLILERYRNATA